MPKSIGEPVLCDFGNAVYGTKINDDDAYPDVYRCPEVMLHLPWSYSADIWNVGAMVSDPFPPKNRFVRLFYLLSCRSGISLRVNISLVGKIRNEAATQLVLILQN